MRELVEAQRPDLLYAVTAAVGADPFAKAKDGTGYLQPAIFCATLASLARFSPAEPDFYAGHSLGEVAALVAAGSLTEEDGLRVVVGRGRLMQSAAEAAEPGAMLAVGMDAPSAAEVARRHGLTVANDNSPEQVVMSGAAAAVHAARAEVKGQGLRAFVLPIKGAFHSPAIEPVTGEFRALLDEVEFTPPRRPVFSCVTAGPLDDPRARLVEALTRGVRWRELLLALHERGVERFVEVGPGRTLTGLVRATLPGAEAVALEEMEAVRG
jgi:acyl transferase domain-containing protein